jgi:uncharacterized membrane protein YeiB
MNKTNESGVKMKKIIKWAAEHKLISLLIILALILIVEMLVQSIPVGVRPSQQQTAADNTAAQAATTTPADLKAQAAQDAADKAAQTTFDNSPAGRICKAHPTWQHDECGELANNKLWITNAAHLGMTYEMLVYLRGEADNTNVSDYGNGKTYQYCWDGYTPSCFYDRDGDGRMDSYN